MTPAFSPLICSKTAAKGGPVLGMWDEPSAGPGRMSWATVGAAAGWSGYSGWARCRLGASVHANVEIARIEIEMDNRGILLCSPNRQSAQSVRLSLGYGE